MGIELNTPVSHLVHGTTRAPTRIACIDLESDELMHWKYIKREKLPNGKWRYYYDKTALEKDAKTAVDKAADITAKRVNKAAANANDWVEKAKKAISKFYDDPDNIYNVTRGSYQKKLEKVKQTKEWQDIIARKDSEYVKKNQDGSTTYLVDDYIIDKKHPVLDAIGDIMSGRKITTQEVTKDTVIAGIKDYATTAIEMGMLATGFVTNGLTRKFKFSMGSYDDDIERLAATVEVGMDYMNTAYETASTAALNARDMSEDELTAMVSKAISDAYPNANREDVTRLVTTVRETVKMAGSTRTADIEKQVSTAAPNLSEKEVADLVSNVAKRASVNVTTSDVETLASIISASTESARQVNEGNVVEAARFLMESDVIKDQYGSNEHYKQAESALSNLTEEEIRLINLLVQEMRR